MLLPRRAQLQRCKRTGERARDSSGKHYLTVCLCHRTYSCCCMLIAVFCRFDIGHQGTASPKRLLVFLPAGIWVAFLVSAILWPWPTTYIDIGHMTLLSLPMIGSYVVSILIAWLQQIHRRERAEKQMTSSLPQS